MSFQPVLPFSGYGGWLFLKRTMPVQMETFRASTALQVEQDYFRDKIGSVTSAEDLVSDRRLLRVALTAFGLEDDVNAGGLIRAILDGDREDPRALVNRLADRRYRAFAEAFDFHADGPSPTGEPGFADRILDRHAIMRFEAAIGEQDETMRLGLNAQRELAELSKGEGSEDAKWFTILGNKPLRAVFETTFGLPSAFASVDIDRQLDTFKTKARERFGDDTVSQFSDPDVMSKLIGNYLAQAAIADMGSGWSSAQAALHLLGSIRPIMS